MVFFSCDGCGEMLKKNQVDPHVQRCRVGCHAVSCVDCSVSFYDDDYKSHTSCVTEAERYEKTVYRGPKKGEVNKSERLTLQEAWSLVIANAVESAPQSIRQNIQQLAAMDNVPRKEKQFRNFTANSLRLRGRDANNTVDAIWKHLSKVRDEEQKKKQDKLSLKQQAKKGPRDADSAANEENLTTNAENAEGGKVEETNGEENSENNGKSNKEWKSELRPKLVKKAMKKVLKKAPNRTMKIKKLRQEIKTKLMLKGMKKELRKLVSQQINANFKKIKLDGKVVTLL